MQDKDAKIEDLTLALASLYEKLDLSEVNMSHDTRRSVRQAIEDIEQQIDAMYLERADEIGGDHDFGVVNGEVVEGDGEWPPVIAVQEPSNVETAARSEMIQRLAELENLVRPLARSSPSMGHNNPPSPVDGATISGAEWVEVYEAARAIQSEAEIIERDTEAVEERVALFKHVAKKLGKWVAKRGTKGIDAFLTTLGAAGGAAVVVDFQRIGDALINAAQAVENWLAILFGVF